MPPMGWSDRDPARGYGRAVQGQRILSLVETLGVRPILVAHSFGAGAGSEAAMAEPGAFRGYVVIAGALGIGRGTGESVPPLALRTGALREIAVASSVTNPVLTGPLLRLFLYRKDRAGPFVDLLRQPFALEGSTDAIADWLPDLLVTPTLPSSDPAAWRKLALPVALIWGEKDDTTPPEQGRALEALIPGAAMTVLPEIGHIPQIEDPLAFQTALVAALADLEARSAGN
jgi:pimeloyl-ACP methyl ester carboxylesterase